MDGKTVGKRRGTPFVGEKGGGKGDSSSSFARWGEGGDDEFSGGEKSAFTIRGGGEKKKDVFLWIGEKNAAFCSREGGCAVR